MSRSLLDHDHRLNVQELSLEVAERDSRKVIKGSAFELARYEVRDFYPYATEEDIQRILTEMQKKEYFRDIQIVDNALGFLRTATAILETHRAYRNELGRLPDSKTLESIAQDTASFTHLMQNTLSVWEDLHAARPSNDTDRLRSEMHGLTEAFHQETQEAYPPKGADLPLDHHVQRLFDLRARCGNLLIESNDLKLLSLHSEIDFVAVLRKSIDEGIIPASPVNLGKIEDYEQRVLGHTITAHENIKKARTFFNELSRVCLLDETKGKFVARESNTMTIYPLVEYMP